MEKVVIFGTAHLDQPWIPGKCSPDGKFKEAIFSRELIKELVPVIQSKGFISLVDYPGLIPDGVNIKAFPNNWKAQQKAELNFRVKYVNEIVNKYGNGNVIYVSLHVNGSGNNNQWMSARGFEIFTSPGKTKADDLATSIWSSVKGYLDGDIRMRSDFSDGDPDKESGLYVLVKTKCPAVLVENLFMDNKSDLALLESPKIRENLKKGIIEGIINYWK